MYTVYGKNTCHFCDLAKKLLAQKNLEFTYIDVMEDAESLKKLKDEGFKTVPQIWKDGEHIGGFTELTENV